MGADLAQLKTDMLSPEVAAALAQDAALVKKHGFSGTPSFVIGSQELRGAYPYGDFKRIIDEELAK